MNSSPPSSSARKERPEQSSLPKKVDAAAPPLGIVTEIRGANMVVAIHPSLAATLQVGELLVAPCTSCSIAAEVVSIQRSKHTHAEVSVVASIDRASGLISAGARELPGVGTHVARPADEIVRAISEDRPSITREGHQPVLLEIAQSYRYPDLTLSFTPEQLFGRHLGIVGSSGGGKSCTVARLIEQCSNHRAKLILLDLTGEYEPLERGVCHVHLGAAHRDVSASRAVCLPFSELTETDLVAILEPEGNLQLSRLQSAIRTLKLLYMEPKLGTDGALPKAHREKRVYEQALEDFKYEIQAPENVFDIYKLPLQIELECVHVYRSQTESNFWGGVHYEDLAACSALIHRTNEILSRGDIGSIFLPNAAPSLISTLEKFLTDDTFSVLRISLEFLPSIHHVREIVANAIGRQLLAMGRDRLFMKKPVLLLVDEAHQVLHPTVSQFVRDFPLDAYHVLAKEGRKYGVSLCVATQRPGDIPEDILSQMGTFIVHRLVGQADRGIVERASGAFDRDKLEELPTLAPGEAVLVGSAFSRPLRMRIKLPRRQPHSHGPRYQELWKR